VIVMADLVLLLGSVAFQDFELPSGINFGGRQRLALHRLPGGLRVIDALGRDDAQISFSGVFTGSDATLRARSLDEMRTAGVALPLTWDIFFYTILISDFHADYHNGWWIPYRITCTVLRDEAAARIQPVASLVTATLADIGTASSYAAGTGVDLSPVQTVLAAPGATVSGTAAFTAVQLCLGNAQSSVAASMSAANASLANVDLANAASPGDGIEGLLAATNASGQLSSLTAAGPYIGRVATNLSNAST
jgi:hypothetical protein